MKTLTIDIFDLVHNEIIFPNFVFFNLLADDTLSEQLLSWLSKNKNKRQNQGFHLITFFSCF